MVLDGPQFIGLRHLLTCSVGVDRPRAGSRDAVAGGERAHAARHEVRPSAAQGAKARGQRERKAQPAGRSIGLGGSPSRRHSSGR